MPLTHMWSQRTRHWTSRYNVHWGHALDHSLPCSLLPTTRPFFDVFGKSTTLVLSLPCLQMASHWAFRYRIVREHLTGPFVVIVTRACHWTARYLVHRGHSIEPFIAILSEDPLLDHWPSQFSIVLKLVRLLHRRVSTLFTYQRKQNHLKKKYIYCASRWQWFVKYVYTCNKRINEHW